MNGQDPKGRTSTSPVKRRLMVGGLLLFAAAWTVAIIYSATTGGRSPERLDDRNAQVVETACLDAQRSLAALPQIDVRATSADRATRVADENRILTVMVSDMRALRPPGEAPATALTGWLDDWQDLIEAREHYVNDLRRIGDEARFVEPATRGIKPIADTMNDWILEQGTRTESCNTGVLQVEVVEGPRTYGAESKS